MKKETAAKHLRDMLFMIQKFRSNAYESLPGYEKLLPKIMPWVFGDNGAVVLNGLVKILDVYDQTNTLAETDFYNMMIILNTFAPQLIAVAPLLDIDPFPDMLEWQYIVMQRWES